jgi:hypothetical protein
MHGEEMRRLQFPGASALHKAEKVFSLPCVPKR